MPADNMPNAEVDVSVNLVRSLLDAQHPDLALLPLTLMANGWDNVIYRLGDHHTVRLPRRAMAAPLVEHELRWLPEFATRLPIAIPAPVRRGEPADDYPFVWSICPYLPGEMAATAPHLDKASIAPSLGEFLRALQRQAPFDAPTNQWRGVPLLDRDAANHERMTQLADIIDTGPVSELWELLKLTTPWDQAPVWVHGDLHPANFLVDTKGHLSAVIDFGDLCSGDPATDLFIGWTFFDEPERSVFRAAAGDIDDATWARARGWALTLTLAYLHGSANNPIMAAIGHDALPRILGR